ncbi:MAG: ArsR/SmtB family transcription factor [Dehalococcoidia bacterium]
MAEHLPPQLLEQVAERFRVLGDASRLAILKTLLEEDEMNVGQIVERLGTTQANVSKHLRVLLAAGVVQRRPVGTAAYYSLADRSVLDLCDIVCGRLREQIRGQWSLITA